MNNTAAHPTTRREALLRLSAGSLLALGLWPGCSSLKNQVGEAKPFRFIAVNDVHYLTPACGEWLEREVLPRMKKAEADFCLFLGDLTEKGRPGDLAAVKDIFHGLGLPVYPVIGNHDYLTQTDCQAYTRLFPMRLNYHFHHRGWQWVGLDTTEGLRYEKTSIQPTTFRMLDDILPRLDRTRPLVLFTHFPLGDGVRYRLANAKGLIDQAKATVMRMPLQQYRPVNADELLDRFRPFNLKAVYCGHYHGHSELDVRGVPVTTSPCCALKRNNHDKTREKGFFVCTVKNGAITREFVEVPCPPVPGPSAG
jgi:hypothetical protein